MQANALLSTYLLVALLSCDSPKSARTTSSIAATDGERDQQSSLALLPEKVTLAPTAANLCKGLRTAMESAKQRFAEEVDVICTGAVPTPLLNQLLATPYTSMPGNQDGDSDDNDGLLHEIFNDELDEENEDGDRLVKLFVAYSMRLNKTPVATLLGEEPYVKQANYDEDGFSISFKFIDPPKNEGDADTSFLVEQYAAREGDRVEFDDVSKHDLKLYRLHQNNFDFLLAARTLVTPTDQFKKSVALRAAMPDPANPSQTISISVMNFTMNGRGEEGRLLETVMDYVRSDMLSVYAFHTK